jgi:hypothetical protein
MGYLAVNQYASLKIIPVCVLVLAFWSHARETVSPVRAPESYALFGSLVELRDDVYSADLNLAGEYAPCNCFSVYGDFSYRLLSYKYDFTLHDQRHEALNMQVNGLNESYLGMKLMPFPFFGARCQLAPPTA